MSETQALLECRDLSFAYDKKAQEVLKNISFTVEAGSHVALIGPNGVGKSTLLKLIVGLLRPQQGEILVEGERVTEKTLSEIRRKVGFVFQEADHQLFLSEVREDLAFGPRNYGLSEDEVKARCDGVLERLGITHLADRKTARLSGGEKKLVSLATVLVLEPKLLILDEPTIALDPRNRRNFMKLLRTLPEACLVATHDLEFAGECCDRVILLGSDGALRAGTPQEILSDETYLEEHGL